MKAQLRRRPKAATDGVIACGQVQSALVPKPAGSSPCESPQCAQGPPESHIARQVRTEPALFEQSHMMTPKSRTAGIAPRRSQQVRGTGLEIHHVADHEAL